MNINVMHLYLVMYELLVVFLVDIVMFGIYLLVRYVYFIFVVFMLLFLYVFRIEVTAACLTDCKKRENGDRLIKMRD